MARAAHSPALADTALSQATDEYLRALTCRKDLVKAAVRFEAARQDASAEACRQAELEVGTLMAGQTLRKAQAQPAWY